MPLFQNAEVLVTIICILGIPLLLVGGILTIWYEEKQKVIKDTNAHIKQMIKDTYGE